MPLGIPVPQSAPVRPFNGSSTPPPWNPVNSVPDNRLAGWDYQFTPLNTLPSSVPTQSGSYKDPLSVKGGEDVMSARYKGMYANPSSWPVSDAAKLLQGQVDNIGLMNDLSKQSAAQNYYWQMALLNARARAAGAGGGMGYMVKYANDAYKNQVAQDLLAFQNASRQLQGSATVRGAMTSRGYANDLSAALQGQQLADEQARIMRDRHLGAAAQSGAAAGAAMRLLPIQQQALTASYQQALLTGDLQSAQAVLQALGGGVGANGSLPNGVSLPSLPPVSSKIPAVTTKRILN